MHQRIPQEQKDPAVLRPHVIRNILFWLQIFFQFCKSSEMEINETKTQSMVVNRDAGYTVPLELVYANYYIYLCNSFTADMSYAECRGDPYQGQA